MNKRAVGAQYETMAADYLRGQGMRILARNYRLRSGEIDLIARDGNTIVFVEVKYRTDERQGNPLEAVSVSKQRTIVRTAQHYLLLNGYREDTPCRFDVVGIEGERIIHIPNAFWG